MTIGRVMDRLDVIVVSLKIGEQAVNIHVWENLLPENSLSGVFVLSANQSITPRIVKIDRQRTDCISFHSR
jgi:hypothetical protein